MFVMSARVRNLRGVLLVVPTVQVVHSLQLFWQHMQLQVPPLCHF